MMSHHDGEPDPGVEWQRATNCLRHFVGGRDAVRLEEGLHEQLRHQSARCNRRVPRIVWGFTYRVGGGQYLRSNSREPVLHSEPNSSSQPTYSQYGVSTNSTSGINVNCPFTIPSFTPDDLPWTDAYIDFNGYSRNPNQAAASCTMYGVSATGGSFIGATATLASKNSSGAQNASNTLFNTSGNSNFFFISCWVPGFTSAFGNSWITDINAEFDYP